MEADYNQTTGESAGLGAGLEYWIDNILALRAGFRDTGGDNSAWRLGTGVRFNRFQLDYGWSAASIGFTPTHRFSVTFRFGPPAPAPGLAGDLFNDSIARGKRRMELGLYEQAILDFQEALRIRPKDETVLKLLLECGEKLRDRTTP
jgi:tetratricopeptide (TPR) repeat protein